MDKNFRVHLGEMDRIFVLQEVIDAVRLIWPESEFDISEEDIVFLKNKHSANNHESEDCGDSCGECLLIEWEKDTSCENEPLSSITITTASDGSQDDIAASVFKAMGARRIYRPDYVHCVAKKTAIKEGDRILSYCGRELGARVCGKDEWTEWSFVDAQHAMNAAVNNDRILLCNECTECMLRILGQQTSRRFIDPLK